MGGRPIVALNVVGFPSKVLGLEVLKKVLEGGFERTRASGAFLVGGHSVQDEEPKYGLVVYGEVDRDAIWRTVGGRPGDRLLLTKPVGTGVAVTAIKAGMVEDPRTAEEAMRWMTTLNDLPLRLSGTLHRSIHAGTDVTGFGLVGHILDMLSESTMDCELNSKWMFHLAPHRGLPPLFHPLHLQRITLVLPAQRTRTAIDPIHYPALFLIRHDLHTLLYPCKTRIFIDRPVISDRQRFSPHR